MSPHFDSMLAKLTCRGRDFGAAVVRSRRALAEFRIRGVSTNIPFLQQVLDDPSFARGDLSTSFIDERPELLEGRASKDRGSKILGWLADTTVNRPHGSTPTSVDPGASFRGSTSLRRHRRARVSASSNSGQWGSPKPCAARPRSP